MIRPDWIQLENLSWKNNKELPNQVTVWLHDNLDMDLREGYDMPYRATKEQLKMGYDAIDHIVNEVCKHFGDTLYSKCTFRTLDGIVADWSEEEYGPLVEVYRNNNDT